MKLTSFLERYRTRAFPFILVLIVASIAFVAGYYIGPGEKPVHKQHIQETKDTPHTKAGEHVAGKSSTKVAKATIWTCSMHPQIRRSGPGKCPICGMDLIPAYSLEHDPKKESIRYSMSKDAKRLAEVDTTSAIRQRGFVKRRLVGMVFEDETRMAALTSRVAGRLDEIHVDFTGVEVKKGDPMVTIWSPDLIKAQVELFETIRSPAFGEAEIKGSEERLIEMGLTLDQIKEIKKRKKPIQDITLRAPISGIVMKKMALLGQFVKEGTVMYDITDLSKVWVKLDAYESDLPWIRYGQKVNFTTPAIPGKTFTGTVLFIDPVLQMDTRSVKVRVEADNPDLALKPHMFVSAEIEAEIDAGGRVINSDWAGKYICPFHPEEVFPTAQICPKSRLPARPAASYGYAPGNNPVKPLIVPHSAVLYTGKRSIVYTEVPGSDIPTYELREIVLGPRTANGYVVYDGLREGERIVTKGNFNIDSAAQIVAKQSMMNARPSTISQALAHEIERVQAQQTRMKAPHALQLSFKKILKEYWGVKDALVAGNGNQATQYAEALLTFMKHLDTAGYSPDIHAFLYRYVNKIVENLTQFTQHNDLKLQRQYFREISYALATLFIGFEDLTRDKVFLFKCPTAFDKTGAFWIEKTRNLKNPYLGKKMITCGELIATFPLEKKLHQPKNQAKEHKSQPKKTSGSSDGSGTKHQDQHKPPPPHAKPPVHSEGSHSKTE